MMTHSILPTCGTFKIPQTLLACLLALLSLAGAEEKPSKLPLSIFCFEYAKDLKSIQVKAGKSAYREVNLSTANVVEAGETLVEGGSLTLFGPAVEGNDHSIAASANVGKAREPLAILTPAKVGEEPPYQSRIVEGAAVKFPVGSYLFVNLSPHPARINFGERSIEIASGSERLFNPKVAQGKLMAMTVEYKPKDVWVTASSSRWAYRKDRRTLVCIQFSPQTERLLIKSIPLR